MTTEVGHHHHHVSPKDLISVEAHLADILAGIRRLPPTLLGITEAEGCVLAEDITASRPLPPFDNSAMDGYAVIAADVADASKDRPVTLRVSGEVAAGDTGAYAVTPGSSLRITQRNICTSFLAQNNHSIPALIEMLRWQAEAMS